MQLLHNKLMLHRTKYILMECYIADFIFFFVNYRILCHTTQPAHLVTSVAVLFLAFLCRSRTAVATISPIWTLLYLGSFSAHFGAQIWMTFVSGLALYFSLPRHTFGSVQKVLFPKYFLLNAGLSFITLTIFLRVKNKELATMEITLQVITHRMV